MALLFLAIPERVHTDVRGSLPCGDRHQAPSGQGSSCGFDGGSWGERGRRGNARGCWQTKRTVSQLDCPLSGETLQHMHTWSLVKTVWSSGPVSVLDRSVKKVHVYCGSSVHIHWLCTRWLAENKSGSDRMKDRWGDSEGEARDSIARQRGTGESSKARNKLIWRWELSIAQGHSK